MPGPMEVVAVDEQLWVLCEHGTDVLDAILEEEEMTDPTSARGKRLVDLRKTLARFLGEANHFALAEGEPA